MPDHVAHYNPTQRFTGLADLYSRCRPNYPESAVAFFLQHCGLKEGSVLVDVGSGTGISARLLAARGLQVIGVEPNADMRRRAESEPSTPGRPNPSYRQGQAEKTTLPSAYADAVLAAQAFHWFEPEAALREFRRILKPQGWVVLMWNERDDKDPFTAGLGAILAGTPEGAALERKRASGGAVLLDHPLYLDQSVTFFPHEQALDEEGLIGRALSASYAPREPAAVRLFTAEVRAIFARFQSRGQVALRYQTSVYLGRRREDPGLGCYL